MGFDDDDEPPFFRRHNRYDLNSKIMLTAIISLSCVVFIVTVLHIYARCILRRQARRRAALQQMMIAAAARAQSAEPPKTGLHPSVIASLPVTVYQKVEETETVECSVCLSLLQDGEMARTLPNCNHTFHADCVDKWLGTQSTCPICRTEAEPRSRPVPEPREGVVTVGPLPPPPSNPPPSAPPLERVGSCAINTEGTSEAGGGSCGMLHPSAKASGPSSSSFRLSSFRKILSGRERSSRRIQTLGGEDGIIVQDLERQ